MSSPPGRSLSRDTFWWCVVLASVITLIVRVLHPPPADTTPDLQVYRGAASVTFDPGALYEFAAPNGGPFTYPPFAALVLQPTTWMSLDVAALVLLAVGLSVLWWVCRQVAPYPGLPWQAGLFAVACLTVPMTVNVRFGQINLLLVGMILLDHAAVRTRYPRGVGTGIATGIKLLPGLLLVHYLLIGERRKAVVATVTAVATVVVTFIVLPAASRTFWFTTVWQTDRVGDPDGPRNRSLHGLVLRHLDGSVADATLILLAAAVLATGFAWARYLARNGQGLPALCVIGVMTSLLSPITWSHHLIWLVFLGLATVPQLPRLAAIATGGWLLLVLGPVPITYLDQAVATDLQVLTMMAGLVLLPLALRRRAPQPAPMQVSAR